MRGTRLSSVLGFLAALAAVLTAPAAFAAEEHGGGEASLVLPDLGSVNFLGNVPGSTLLSIGMPFSVVRWRPQPSYASKPKPIQSMYSWHV